MFEFQVLIGIEIFHSLCLIKMIFNTVLTDCQPLKVKILKEMGNKSANNVMKLSNFAIISVFQSHVCLY